MGPVRRAFVCMGLWAAERKRVIVLGTVADSERNDTPEISAFWGPHKGLKKMKMRNPRPFIYRFWISPSWSNAQTLTGLGAPTI